jgi:hypothetical protein
MVKVDTRLFLVVGADFLQRQRAIENIKRRVFKNHPTSLNTLIFYSKEIDLSQLKKKIFTFSFDKEKIVILKNAEFLSKEITDFFFKNIKKILLGNYLIFEIEKDYYNLRKDKNFLSHNFFRLLLSKAKIFKVPSYSSRVSLEEFKKSIRRRDLDSSLYILEKLFKTQTKEKEIGMQVLGILIKEFSSMQGMLEREKNLSYLWEADRSIKEKRLNYLLVLNRLLVKILGKEVYLTS